MGNPTGEQKLQDVSIWRGLPAISKTERRAKLAAQAFGIATAGGILAGLLGWRPGGLIVAVVGLAAQLTCVIIWFREKGRTRRFLESIEYRACLGCGHDLRGLDDEGSCPECGGRYRLSRLRAEWMDAYRKP